MNPSDYIPSTHPKPVDMVPEFVARSHRTDVNFKDGITAERRRMCALLIDAATALLSASKDAGATPDGFRAQGAAEALIALGTGLS